MATAYRAQCICIWTDRYRLSWGSLSDAATSKSVDGILPLDFVWRRPRRNFRWFGGAEPIQQHVRKLDPARGVGVAVAIHIRRWMGTFRARGGTRANFGDVDRIAWRRAQRSPSERGSCVAL